MLALCFHFITELCILIQNSQTESHSSSAFRILLESDEDRLLVVFNRGLILMTEVSTSLHFTVDVPHCNVTCNTVLGVFEIYSGLLYR